MEYGPASSNSVNIISADSSVISSLDEDDEGPTTAKPPNKKAKEETSSQQSIKREINVNKSIYIGGGGGSNNNSSNNKSNQGESVQSSFFQQSGPVAAAAGKSTPPIFGGRSNAQQFKNVGKMNNVPGSEYLNNYYINRQEFGGGKGGENFNEFQKLVVRPQYAMQFGDQQKPEGKTIFLIETLQKY